jgi:type IV secretory pathway TraG/TraD family ATPase VirD4
MMPFWQIEFVTESELPRAPALGGGDLLLPILILVAVGIALVSIGVLFVVRFFLRRAAFGRGGALELTVLQIMIPKFRREEEAARETNIEQIRQGIALAESFFATIGGLKAQRGFMSWFLGRTDELAFEIVADKGLIKFFVAVPKKLQQYVEQQIAAVYPDAHIEESEDYNIFTPTGTILGGYLVFKRPFAFPIKTYQKLEADPLSALTNALSKLSAGDGAAVQYIIRSAKKQWRSRGLAIARKMQQGMSLEDALAGKAAGKKKEGWVSLAMSSGAEKKPEEPQQQYRLSPLEEESVKGLEQKASKAGVDVNIRIVASSEDPNTASTVMANLVAAFNQYNLYQFGNVFDKAIPPSKKKLIRRFIYRTFDEKYRVVLNSEEMASLWHLPLPTTETPNIEWLLARRAAAPVNVPTEGLFLGYNVYRGRKTPIHIKRADRQRHMYVIGKSGSGKSQFIAGLAAQDIRNGEGVCVVDPHGDLVEQILGSIPRERIDDVIVFNPSDLDRPMGLNMLEVKNENLRDFAVQEMISVFYKLFPPEMIGPMFEHNMRNVMLTLMSDPEQPGTLAEIPRMFSDQDFADQWIAKLKDPVVRAFWEKEMAKTSDFHKSEMLGYLISKVGRFVENEMMRNIIGQPRNSFDFREVMDKQKILLVNLSKGKTGEVNAQLLGLIIVSKLQMAAMGRADMAEEDRKDFYLYIDEFQNFVTDSIATILSEARKYRLNLIMGHQYMNQLVESGGKTTVRDAVLGNVGTMLVSRIGPEDSEILEKVYSPTFSGYDLINSEQYTWYTKMIIDNNQAKPFTMKSVPGPKADRELADAINQLSRLKFGRDKALVEADILERTQLGATGPQQGPPVGETAF